MCKADLILKYFPDLTSDQISRFSALDSLYRYWNERINVISRKDIDHLYLRHILHSLAIGKFFHFPANSQVLDVGTGGGFPGIPLAILFPEVNFTLADSIGKKIKVVNEIKEELNCNNVKAVHIRAEKLKFRFDFVVSRAVTNMPRFVDWVKPLLKTNSKESFRNGIIALKGGDLDEELKNLGGLKSIISISDYFEEDFFASKKIVFLRFK